LRSISGLVAADSYGQLQPKMESGLKTSAFSNSGHNLGHFLQIRGRGLDASAATSAGNLCRDARAHLRRNAGSGFRGGDAAIMAHLRMPGWRAKFCGR
jgi:hypothetical protein